MRKFNPYRQAAGDQKRVYSQINLRPAVIWQQCKQCGKNVKVEGVLVDNMCDECREKEGTK